VYSCALCRWIGRAYPFERAFTPVSLVVSLGRPEGFRCLRLRASRDDQTDKSSREAAQG